MIAFVSGGARSGKSEVAEQLVRQWGERESSLATYIATAIRSDEEMSLRIQFHLARRGAAWTTFELAAASDLAQCLQQVPVERPILLDCLTIWLSRMLFEEGREPDAVLHYWSECMRICSRRQLALVIVSNDLNEGLPMTDETTNLYIRVLETVHRWIVDDSLLAVQVVAGLPIVWKGNL